MTADIVASAWDLHSAALAATGRDGPAGPVSDRAGTSRESGASSVREAAEDASREPLTAADRDETRVNWEAAWAAAERDVDATLEIGST